MFLLFLDRKKMKELFRDPEKIREEERLARENEEK